MRELINPYGLWLLNLARQFENTPKGRKGLDMKSHGQQREVATTRIGEINHRFKNLNGSARSLIPEPRNRRFVETLAGSAVMEERNRLAREIHDTLVQEFAGILLHLEAANGSDE